MRRNHLYTNLKINRKPTFNSLYIDKIKINIKYFYLPGLWYLLILMSVVSDVHEEEFEDTKGEIRICMFKF
jgi:hypothetical protein